ncbi:hypothetical protein Tco_0261827 [Tanacetum coccineum]
MFDEYFNPPAIDVSPVRVATKPIAVDIAKSHVSTSIDLDAPSTSIISTQEQEHSPIISQGFEESPKTPHFHDDPLHESLHEDSTSQGSSSNVRPSHTLFEHLGRWTKDHPIANVIEPKNFKQAMTEPSWIDAMQEEIHEFERLQVWELVLCPDKVMLIKLKRIYKVKTDEFRGLPLNKLHTKNSLVAPEKSLKIEKCNARIAFSKPQREETYQVTLDALKLSPCYLAFLIIVEVPEVYMHQFWNTIQKICRRVLNQDFIAPPLKEDLVAFIQELGYSGKCDMLSAIHTDQMHQPWR